ncbi:hypothetical protein [Burkholderia orbicola]|uniref:hypothetical protein n=1 Tax=Burkholderia orbicola TaxID=2978683 RepID=UPI00264DE2F9|nr:hypothetical protein [Burkholderia orbicola]MDN7558201.1 hypothetical protein [Burkholderia orbicola]
MGIEDLLFGGTMGFNAGKPRASVRLDGTYCECLGPETCQQRGYCVMQRGLDALDSLAKTAPRHRYDIDLAPDAVREVKPMLSLPAPLIEGDSDGGECD